MVEKKVSGIANLGNTCYMNSAVQCGIVACEPLANYFLSDQYLEDISVSSNGSLSKAVCWLLDEIRNPDNRNTIYPNMLKSRIDEKIPRFKGTEQHDCSEFLIELLDVLHMELSKARTTPPSRSSSLSILTRSASSLAAMNGSIAGKSMSSINWRTKGDQWWTPHRKKANSIIKRLFEGAIRSVMTCTRCGGVSARFEPFTSLILPLAIDGVTSASTASLDSLIKELFKPEELSGIDCDYCKRKQIFNRTIDIWKLPPFLMLTLSRFSFDYRAVARKVTTFVDYPSETLPVEELVAREAPLQEFTDYELYAVIEHEGTVNRGHYTALVKTENGWISANDARVVRIVDESNVVNRNAYMLFYRWRVIGDKSAMFDLDDYLS